MARHKEKFYTIKGYFTSPLLYSDMVDRYPDGSIFIEVGVYRGRSLYYLLKKIKESGKNITVYGVDYYKGQSDGFYDETLSNLSEFNGEYKLLRTDSVSASKIFKNKSIDFVFIDAGHAYEEVKSDIDAWLPKVKKGGIISGHDYIYDDNAVKKVVDELFGERMDKKYLPENCWMVEI